MSIWCWLPWALLWQLGGGDGGAVAERKAAGRAGQGRAGQWEGRSSKGSREEGGGGAASERASERGAMVVVQPLRLTPTTLGNRQNRRYCPHH
jgi:hypothetical protein